MSSLPVGQDASFILTDSQIPLSWAVWGQSPTLVIRLSTYKACGQIVCLAAGSSGEGKIDTHSVNCHNVSLGKPLSIWASSFSPLRGKWGKQWAIMESLKGLKNMDGPSLCCRFWLNWSGAGTCSCVFNVFSDGSNVPWGICHSGWNHPQGPFQLQ